MNFLKTPSKSSGSDTQPQQKQKSKLPLTSNFQQTTWKWSLGDDWEEGDFYNFKKDNIF